ncbi:MAG TPA: DsbA family protein [Longimicrobiales bacterium]|nr:DsbA family protein [Longimicrobiales bacterium]
MKKLYLVLVAVAVVGVAAVAYSVGSGGSSAASAPVAVEGLDDLERLVELAQGVTRGNEDATVTIIEFGDYQCPACQAFAMQVKPQVDLAYIESGKAKFVFYDWPIVTGHPNAFLAARAARCAGDQGQYWEFHDNLFRNQSRWAPLTNPVGQFADYAESIGLDGGTFRACLNSDQYAELVTANMELGNQLGVNGTPTIYVEQGGSARRVGMDFQSISQYIDEILADEAGGS